MDDEVKILAVPIGTEISESVANILAQKGVVIIRSESPELVRLVTKVPDLDVLPANEFMWAAIDALAMTEEKYSQPDADKLRRRFVGNLAEVTRKQRRKLIGWSAETKS